MVGREGVVVLGRTEGGRGLKPALHGGFRVAARFVGSAGVSRGWRWGGFD